MGLVGISNELQFYAYNHGEPFANPLSARDGELFYGGEKEFGRAILYRLHSFSLAESLPGKKRNLSSSCCVLLSELETSSIKDSRGLLLGSTRGNSGTLLW